MPDAVKEAVDCNEGSVDLTVALDGTDRNVSMYGVGDKDRHWQRDRC
jgi:hypothetical protein